jgi:hypothetical protein
VRPPAQARLWTITMIDGERPIDIVWALARESLAQRDRAEAGGWAMTPMPHETEVRALLAALPATEPVAAGLDIDLLARAICASRPPEEPADLADDMFVDDECRGIARRAIEMYAARSTEREEPPA